MFQTYESAKLPIFGTDENGIYSYVELIGNISWFYAICKLRDGSDFVTSIYMLSVSSQIIDLMNIPEISIKSVYLVSPPHQNGTDSWKMSQLYKISEGKVSKEDYESYVEIYELINGETIYSSSEINSYKEIQDIKVVYS